MARQIDIDWAARIMIARHGKAAAAAAQRRITELLKSNDIDVAAIWVRVERAIRVIQGPTFPALVDELGDLPDDEPHAATASQGEEAGPNAANASLILLRSAQRVVPVLRISGLEAREIAAAGAPFTGSLKNLADRLELAADGLSSDIAGTCR